jgi:tetratricopeptide (TPR) repeat protein
MARADRRSAQRAKQTPGIRASGAATAVEQTLFFTRIRRRAKWVFVFLAASFAIGFVVFGVGTSGGGGIGDILQGRSAGTGGPSVKDARKKVDARPSDPAALRELVTALQNEGRADEALPIMERYTQVRPRDADALAELATLYALRAGRLRAEAQNAELRAQLSTPGTDILPPASSPLGQALGNLPITNAVASKHQKELTDKIEKMQEAFRDAQQVYERIVVLKPEDAGAQRELGYAALNAGDNTTALAAFKHFLALAPDDPEAPLVKQQVKQIEASVTPPPTR